MFKVLPVLALAGIASGRISGHKDLDAARINARAAMKMKMQEVDLPKKDTAQNYPFLFEYNPQAASGAIVMDSSKTARFTVLTPYLIRMEQVGPSGDFEDRATQAMVNRNLPVPSFTSNESNGVLTIQTSAATLTYTVGSVFSPSTLSVTTAMNTWHYGDVDTGNLFGTVRGLDQQTETSLNCSADYLSTDNEESLHCEMSVFSRLGWSIYDDTLSYCLDDNWWWDYQNPTIPSNIFGGYYNGYDVVDPFRTAAYPNGVTTNTADDCQALCIPDATCSAFIFENSTASPNCWPLAGWGNMYPDGGQRIFGRVIMPASNRDQVDLYGFFHGLNYRAAIQDLITVSGRPQLPSRSMSGVLFSRWLNDDAYDVNTDIIHSYAINKVPLSVYISDMQWHWDVEPDGSSAWGSFSPNTDLYPNFADFGAWIEAHGLSFLMNMHDASGVNNFENLWDQFAEAIGVPLNTTLVPFNILNSTVAYAVQDILIGVFRNQLPTWNAWIDYQQAGSLEGLGYLQGNTQNPTLWLNHLYSTARQRNGDNNRAFVLARYGGLGAQRYPVGFSGDVAGLTWPNMVWQPYFSATAANVAFPTWSHDIEGPYNDLELYTRWVQIGAFSGTMRSHDRGMAGGGCADDVPNSCSIVEIWKTDYPHFDAMRLALTQRAALLPYIYSRNRELVDTGVGVVYPMYYDFPSAENAYLMDGLNTTISQYMFGPSILFSPVTTPGVVLFADNEPISRKMTWLPPGSWYETTSGSVHTVDAEDVDFFLNKSYAMREIPLFYAAGAVIPYLPLHSLNTMGFASPQYTFLGFQIVPGASTGSGSVYEDDGQTTDYLTKNASVWTTCTYNYNSSNTLTISVSSSGSYPAFPTSRAMQFRILNSVPIVSATINGQNIPFNRFGRVQEAGKLPASNYWYFAVEEGEGLGAIISLASVSTSVVNTLQITFSTAVSQQQMSGVYGAIMHATWAKQNMDIDRSTPTATGDSPVYVAQLGVLGAHLSYLAGNDAQGFANAVLNVPSLLSNATAQLLAQDGNNVRLPYSIAMLNSAF